MFDNSFSLDDFCVKFKEVFQDENVLKITMNSKNDMHILSKYGIELNNYFDLSVADYLMSSGLKNRLENVDVDGYEDLKDELLSNINQKKLNFVYNNIEVPLTQILFQMEKNGFKIDKEKLNSIDLEFEERIKALTNEIFLQAGEEFNINSPKQVAHILFDKLGIKAYNNKKQSTSANVLDELKFITQI